MFTFVEPPMLTEVLTAAAVAVSSTAGPTKCKLLRIQLQPGKTIAYRVTKSGQALTPATTNDARIRGDTHISFHSGDVLSVIEVTDE
jgi:hypothetical protein